MGMASISTTQYQYCLSGRGPRVPPDLHGAGSPSSGGVGRVSLRLYSAAPRISDAELSESMPGWPASRYGWHRQTRRAAGSRVGELRSMVTPCRGSTRPAKRLPAKATPQLVLWTVTVIPGNNMWLKYVHYSWPGFRELTVIQLTDPRW